MASHRSDRDEHPGCTSPPTTENCSESHRYRFASLHAAYATTVRATPLPRIPGQGHPASWAAVSSLLSTSRLQSLFSCSVNPPLPLQGSPGNRANRDERAWVLVVRRTPNVMIVVSFSKPPVHHPSAIFMLQPALGPHSLPPDVTRTRFAQLSTGTRLSTCWVFFPPDDRLAESRHERGKKKQTSPCSSLLPTHWPAPGCPHPATSPSVNLSSFQVYVSPSDLSPPIPRTWSHLSKTQCCGLASKLGTWN